MLRFGEDVPQDRMWERFEELMKLFGIDSPVGYFYRVQDEIVLDEEEIKCIYKMDGKVYFQNYGMWPFEIMRMRVEDTEDKIRIGMGYFPTGFEIVIEKAKSEIPDTEHNSCSVLFNGHRKYIMKTVDRFPESKKPRKIFLY